MTEQSGASGAGRTRVLVVDDEPLVLRVLQGVLSSRGYQVWGALNGTEALELASREGAPIDVLVTDVIMPGMNGVELARLMSRIRPGLRVLFTAGMPDTPTIQSGIVARGYPLLAKPFLPAELDAKIRELLSATLARGAAG